MENLWTGQGSWIAHGMWPQVKSNLGPIHSGGRWSMNYTANHLHVKARGQANLCNPRAVMHWQWVLFQWGHRLPPTPLPKEDPERYLWKRGLCNSGSCGSFKVGLPRWLRGKEITCECKKFRRRGFSPWVGKIIWRRIWQPTLVSCVENSMDRGVWWATVHEVTKNRTWLTMDAWMAKLSSQLSS